MEKEITGETLKQKQHSIWESLTLSKGSPIVEHLSMDPVIFFVLSGSVRFKVSDVETHTVSSEEMFMVQVDSSCEITMLETTHVIICNVPMDFWYKEQKWIEGIISDNGNISGEFNKLPIKRMIINYLQLLDLYIKERLYSQEFFELKRQELFFLLVHHYPKDELSHFLQCVLSNDIQFKNLVMNNYLQVKNVQELAKLANYSTSGFIKKFQRCFNNSPYKWMQAQKAKKIFIDITTGIKSLQEIANEYKFSSYQHFSVFCKAQLGVPPTAISGKIKAKNTLLLKR